MKLFLDANLLFSASLSATGTAQALLVAAANAGASCICSEHVLAEAQRNLSVKAPQALARLALISELLDRVAEPGPAHIDAAPPTRTSTG